MKPKQTPKESTLQRVDVIARLLNLSPRRIQQLSKEGRIPSARRGLYEVVPTVRGYSKYLQDLVAAQGNTASVHAAEVLKQRAAKLKRENEMAADQYIPARDVAVGIAAAHDHIRSRMLAIPAKVAPACLAAEGVGDVKTILQEHVHAALGELSRTRFVAIGEDEPPAPKKRRRGKAPS